MKKMIMAVAIVCAAVASQAASYSWTVSGLKDMNGVDLNYDVALTVMWVMDGTTAKDPAVEMGSWTVSNGAQATKVVFEDSNITAGVVQKFTFSYEDKDGNIFTSKQFGSKAQATSTPNLAFSMTGGTWTAAPVPEPTSAMLVLLGIAGFALKRKCA